MMIFWWQGKGYWTLAILLLNAALFGLILQAVPIIEEGAYFWAISLAVAAAVNWRVGCRYNSKKRASRHYTPRRLLFYPARHRTMGLPMEAWSPILATIAVAIFAYDLTT